MLRVRVLPAPQRPHRPACAAPGRKSASHGHRAPTFSDVGNPTLLPSPLRPPFIRFQALARERSFAGFSAPVHGPSPSPAFHTIRPRLDAGNTWAAL
ncbi:hypothetical protein B0H11DRAFT_2214427 [Mycena galericulata]|nr:hypothetical protein B0H11DRAFT_2214427 [Mycena galericulata]